MAYLINSRRDYLNDAALAPRAPLRLLTPIAHSTHLQHAAGASITVLLEPASITESETQVQVRSYNPQHAAHTARRERQR